MNEALGETDEEGEVTPATFANAEAAETALTEKVTEAEEARDDELANADASAFEIFAVQEGADTVLYVEKEVFAGSSSVAAADNSDLVQVKLVGVNAEDLQFDGGFLTLA
ncbi:hypothetical protein [Paenalcaligenes faecalis]|uniref:hypothetical protein n=1 Tax=Paenalcaligenes faecalis TaxID=2980099 RepID=UPI0022B9A088|nr:hypothetical protein [Paenalcaligenes faecalis]